MVLPPPNVSLQNAYHYVIEERMNRIIYLSIIIALIVGCRGEKKTDDIAVESQRLFATTGSVERLDPRMDQLIAKDAVIEILADGHVWTEGPLWVEDGQYLLYSDIPPNQIYKWSERGGKELYLEPSGYTGEDKRAGEPGSNGLLLDAQGRLVLCQHGDRRLARMIPAIDEPSARFETIVGDYEGKRFNSPNDAVYDKAGNLYFTDPPYGLEGNVDDPAKELDYQGVFRYSTEGRTTLLAADIPRPNGIGLSPDETKLYVASSEGAPQWSVIDISPTGEASNQRVFHDNPDAQSPGAPDGLKIDDAGHIWATGPGGVWVFSPDGTVLGKIKTGERTSNCAFNADKSILYMTCDDYLMRIKLR